MRFGWCLLSPLLIVLCLCSQILAQEAGSGMPQSLPAPDVPIGPPAVGPQAVPPGAPLPSEPIIDLRQPNFDPSGGEAGEGPEPSWINEFIDDHRLLPKPVTGSWEFLARDNRGLGITTLTERLENFADFGPFWISPTFRWSFLNGPVGPDAPPQVWDFALETNFAGRLTDQLTLHLQLTPLFSTDLDNTSSDAFRLAAGGMLTYQAEPDLRFVGGFAYLDRPDLEFLPVVGVRWEPTENVELDLLVPKPRIAVRLFEDESHGESWLYFGGDVGGSSWAIERELRRQDRMGYVDLRLVLGIETRSVDALRTMLEFDYVFARKLDFERYRGDQSLSPTFAIRWGTTF